MKPTVFILPLLLCLGGCIAAQSTVLPADDLRREIRSGNLISPGDDVVVTLSGGERTRLTVVEVTPDHLRGRDAAVAIDDILTAETRRVSFGRTALAAGGSFVGTILLLAVLIGAG